MIDDIATINSDGIFAEYFKYIYPCSIELNKENTGNVSACVLDLDINIVNGKFRSSIYDKRDDFKFDVVQFQPCAANQASSISYGVFRSQVIRYSRICTHYSSFYTKCNWLLSEFLTLGYNRIRLVTLYKSACRQHGFGGRFGRDCRELLDT